uniref:Conserved oligomeric Golgi complex subunit 7 n=1 Tax=Toxocara canis TaxID=6265 RepID=A0A183TZI6_TOXCA
LDLPQLGDNWSPADIVKWINARNESSAELLEAVEVAISETKTKFDATKAKVERMKEDEDALGACARSCLELRDRLKMMVEAQAKEKQFAKKFDEIAVYDQADRRATELVNIVKARIAWKEGVKAIESLDEGEPAPENVVFSLQDAYNVFSKQVAVPERREFLEKVKDVFLSWYSTRVVLALQSDTPAESLIPIKNKYDLLHRTDDFNAVVTHYIRDQSKLDLHEVNSLPDLFIDLQRTILANYTRFREGRRWAEKVLDSPSEYVANALYESILMQWDEVRAVCKSTIAKTLEEDTSGALSLRMVLALKQLLSDVAPQNEEDGPIMECVLKIGNRLLEDVAAGYSKLASSFLTTYANIILVRYASFSFAIDDNGVPSVLAYVRVML